MESERHTPQKMDAILGGQTPSPNVGAVLGGVDGIRQALKSDDLAVKLGALDKAWQMGENGQVCLHEALEDRSKVVRRRARWLLRQPDPSTGQILMPPTQWNLRERLLSNGNTQRIAQFNHRELREFQPDQPVENPPQFAIGVRCDWDDTDIIERFSEYIDGLPQMDDADQIESLVIGVWGDGEYVCTGDASSQGVVTMLAEKSDRLPNLKSLFIGEITYEECEISWLIQSDMSPLLKAYPQLELLQVRGGNGLEFKVPETSVTGSTQTIRLNFTFDEDSQHESLKALIVETGGLSRRTVQQICRWDFPALEHLELWFGSAEYGGDCWEQDLAPVLDELVFPDLTYLGIRNCPFIDEAMDRIVRSPLLGGLQVLDLSLGILTDTGASKLLDCPAIRDLEILNVSENYLSGAMIDQLQTLGIEVIATGQRAGEIYDDEEYRYCVVSE